VVDELKIRAVPDVLNVLERPGVEVVDADDTIPVPEEEITEVGAEKPGTACNNRSSRATTNSSRETEERTSVA
jgi:hypothetical protein